MINIHRYSSYNLKFLRAPNNFKECKSILRSKTIGNHGAVTILEFAKVSSEAIVTVQ